MEEESQGLWPQYRHDERLSGMQPLPGTLHRSEVAWRHYLGGPLYDVQVFRHNSETQLLVLYGGCLLCRTLDGDLCWKSDPLGLEGLIAVADVDRDGRTEVLTSNGKSIVVLDAATGKTLWQEYLGPPFAGGFMHTGALLHHFPEVGPGMQLAVGLLSSREVILYDFSSGAAAPERRHILWMDDFFHPSLLAVDIDGDGQDELVVTKYSAVYVFDPVTGKEKGTCRWTSGGTPKRNYGLFAARDLDGKGRPDLVVLSQFVTRHLAVVENCGPGDLRLRWDRFLEHIYPDDEKDLRYTFNSVVDIDGDGEFEIVVSTFNDQGDGRWWLEILNARTGSARFRYPDLYVRGIERIDGEVVLLTSRELQRSPSDFSELSMLVWQDDGLELRWQSHSRCAFSGRFVGRDAVTAPFRAELPPADEIWCRNGLIPLRTPDHNLLLLQRNRDEWEELPLPGVGNVAAVVAFEDLDGDGREEILLAGYDGRVSLAAPGREPRLLFHAGMRFRPGTGPYYMAKPMSAPILFEGKGVRYCAVPDGGIGIHLLQWNEQAGTPEYLRTVTGRGRIGPEEAFQSVTAYPCEGESCILMSEVGGDVARLKAVNVHGDVVRSWKIADLPGTPEVPCARIGIHEYLPMRLDGMEYIFVSGFRSHSMNSEISLLLSAETGGVLRYEQSCGNGREVARAPWNAASLDWSAEGPVLSFMAKDTLCRIDPTTGEFLDPPTDLRPFNTRSFALRRLRMDDFSAYGVVLPVDVEGNGGRQFLLGANYGGFGLFEQDLTMRWWRSEPLSMLTGGCCAVADIDNDGIAEIGLSTADGDFICLRADTGLEKWRLHPGETASDVVACDIDGDGAIEFLFGTREGGLWALGAASNGVGLVKWRLNFDFSLGPLAVGDWNSDGGSEILVVCGDGYLYGIGERREPGRFPVSE